MTMGGRLRKAALALSETEGWNHVRSGNGSAPKDR